MINILPNSYIQRHYIISGYDDPLRQGIYNEYYTRKDDFDSRLLFTSNHKKLYYFIVNDDKKIILNGKLNGHFNDIDYDYRFDFDEYIVFNYEFTNRQKSVVYNEINIEPLSYTPTQYNTLGEFINVVSEPVNNCKLRIYFSPENMIQINTYGHKITQNSNGEYYVIDFDTVVNDDFIYVNFWNMISSNMLNDTSTNNYIAYGGNDILIPNEKYLIINGLSGGTTVMGMTMVTSSNTYVYTYLPTATMLIDIPDDIVSLTITNNKLKTNKVYYPIKKCYTSYYFFNRDTGYLDRILAEGFGNITDNVTRESIRLGNRLVQTKIKNVKKIRHNTGFNITNEQILNIIENPYVYKLENGKFKRYLVETNEFTGFNGKNLSRKNVELVFIDEKQYEKKTDYLMSFFD